MAKSTDELAKVREFAALLAECGDLMGLLGDHYRAMAYQRASFEAMSGKMGKTMMKKWEIYQSTGRFPELDALKRDPKTAAIIALCKMIGVGPKIAAKWIARGIRDITSLRAVVARGKIHLTPVQTLGIRHYEDLNKRLTRRQCEEVYTMFTAELMRVAKDLRTELAGSYRRGKEFCGDVDILVGCPVGSVAEHGPIRGGCNLETISLIVTCVEKLPLVGWILKGDTRMTFLVKGRGSDYTAQVDLLLAPMTEWGAALLYLTGSAHYNEWMRHVAKKQGFLLNQKGLTKIGKPDSKDWPTEEGIFEALHLPYETPSARI